MAVPAAAAALLATEAGKILAESFLEKLLDPSVNEALSPTAGLDVQTLAFQAVETEGRWKTAEERFNPERLSRLNTPENGAKGQKGPSTATGGVASPGPAEIARTYGRVPGEHRKPLLTLEVTAVHRPSGQVARLLGGDLVLAGSQALASRAEVGVRWYSDELEIWGGLAGLTWAKGFGSTYGHRGRVVLGGTPYGNYFPARYMIAFAGSLNPVGPSFQEFRGAVVVSAASERVEPLFCEAWDRTPSKARPIRYGADGYLISASPL